LGKAGAYEGEGVDVGSLVDGMAGGGEVPPAEAVKEYESDAGAGRRVWFLNTLALH